MATQTPYFGLSKPAGIEAALIGVINADMDILDTELWMSFVRAAINLAPIYDETSSYVEGDYCTKLVTIDQTVTGFHLYKCTTDTTDPAGTFDTNSWTEVDITSEMGHGGGGGGGHIYLDNSGNVMTQRTKAKFEGAYTTDNAANDITNVAVLRTMSTSDFGQLTEAEKQGFIYVYDETTGTDDKFQPVIYSTEEREIGVWTDGKPLYEKTWKFTTDIALTPNTWADTPIEILANNIGKIIKVTGLYSTTSYSFLGAQCDTGDYVRILSCRPSNMLVDGLILQYTKITDEPGSGQWTPQGVPTVHYSTDEKVVGTWIDGSTIYERTYDLNDLTLAANGWTDTAIALGNAQGEYTLIDAKVMISDNGVPATQVTPWSQNGKLAIFNTRTIQLTAKYITIQYTKESS